MCFPHMSSNDMIPTNVLLTCAGRRNCLVKFFQEALGDRGLVFAADMSADAPALQRHQRAQPASCRALWHGEGRAFSREQEKQGWDAEWDFAFRSSEKRV